MNVVIGEGEKDEAPMLYNGERVDVADVVDLDAPIAENLRRIAERRGMRAEDVTVAVLDRDPGRDMTRSGHPAPG